MLATVQQARRLVTEIPGPRSRALADRRAAAVAPGVASTMGVYAARADGGIVVDVDGNHLIDLGSGIAVTSVGASHPDVVAAVQRQVADFTHTCFMVTPYEGYVAVAEALNRLAPGAEPKRSALFNSGAEAVENAVKIARSHTGRPAVVVFDHAYHGRTNLTMAMTARTVPYKKGFGPFADRVHRVPGSYPYRDRLSGPDAAARSIEALAAGSVDPSSIAAVVVEPIQGEGGFIVPAPGFLAALASWCAEHGIVFVADEVQSGFARTGAMFACDHEGVVPDLITSAKGIAGGMPLAAVTGRATIMDSAGPGGLGGTFGGNPVSCAAALAAIGAMESEDLAGRANRIGERMLDRLGSLQQRDSRIGDVRGRGAMVALELVHADRSPDPDLARRVAAHAHGEGVIVLTCGTDGNVIRLLPPLGIADGLLDEGLAVIEAGLAQDRG